MPTATSHMSAGTRAGKPSAPAKDSLTKVDAEGVGEIEAHPSRIPTAGPISQIGVLAPSGAPCPPPQLLRDRAQAGGSSREEPARSSASQGEGTCAGPRYSTISPTPSEFSADHTLGGTSGSFMPSPVSPSDNPS